MTITRHAVELFVAHEILCIRSSLFNLLSYLPVLQKIDLDRLLDSPTNDLTKNTACGVALQVNMDGMDDLVKLLAIVKSHGLDGAFSDDSHYFGRLSDRENITFQSYQEPLRSMRCSLQEAKICMGALNNISAHLTKKIRCLQKRCKPFVLADGINRIPDEILANIFEAGHRIS
ncbi:hypothetical protein BD410DRAFT_203780 [Rickenella mellea]|uniref:Uncharacterized protein n=1 Tax=Rickenella mellea TaxID=50990 RepID=A0A4Y7PJ52_9AGAM|nr:hypothetical protein BD410DRAFT_203780 [Rickenella mellea]